MISIFHLNLSYEYFFVRFQNEIHSNGQCRISNCDEKRRKIINWLQCLTNRWKIGEILMRCQFGWHNLHTYVKIWIGQNVTLPTGLNWWQDNRILFITGQFNVTDIWHSCFHPRCCNIWTNYRDISSFSHILTQIVFSKTIEMFLRVK